MKVTRYVVSVLTGRPRTQKVQKAPPATSCLRVLGNVQQSPSRANPRRWKYPASFAGVRVT